MAIQKDFISNLQELDKVQGREDKQKKQSSIIKNIIVKSTDNMKDKLKMIDKVEYMIKLAYFVQESAE